MAERRNRLRSRCRRGAESMLAALPIRPPPR
jgi:hypothetical protein